MDNNCDFSPLKEKIKESLAGISVQINGIAQAIHVDQGCLLKEFSEIRERFTHIESVAASFYLRCYLAPYTDLYVELAKSIEHLSVRRHGALIVVRRNEDPHPWLQHGVPVGASFTDSLMESIFYPGSPLHDGAVLIVGDQIVSAAHVLPLTNRSIEGRKLGTRHRAAIGITEQCDALSIVVSEETGRPSFAVNGELYSFRAEALHDQPSLIVEERGLIQ
ncbi:sporulation-specific diadenylate cyclase CdaS [Marininema halotolerans]|uniref:Membrane-spanning protein N-terminus n=1 Tax=Marininema halotolerans TaxID=1155944 RepID=A0A1I6NS24_9BACL|nr:sporulation-specific diadenylate cyclase CdaS [Marininema halotolerans]SFS30723.1 membrane-spanning protein N-terminus [Marininema halotolerans]